MLLTRIVQQYWDLILTHNEMFNSNFGFVCTSGLRTAI